MKTTLLLLLTLLFCGAAQAQSNDSLVVLFLSGPGFRPAGLMLVLGDGNATRWDASGDGRPDLVMTREDGAGNLRDILIVNPASLDTLWRVQDVPTTLGLANIFVQLWGFADANGDGKREALFTTDTEVRAYDPGSNELAYMLGLGMGGRLLGAIDLTGDTHEEIVASALDAGVVVWTRPD